MSRIAASARRAVGRLAVVAAGLALTVSGCSFGGLYDVPLPGGADLGDHPYHVTAVFADVLDLVPQSAVKVNDVTVGKVDSIDLDRAGWTARVHMRVNGSVRLPANAEAALRQSSLLGEKFVELRVPIGEPPQGGLADHATIPVERTGRGAQVEEVLGAMSLLLNGGGIEKIRTIAQELNKATTGREPRIRALLSDLDIFVGGLDQQRDEITRALDSTNRLAATLSAQRVQIAGILDGLAPGLRVLDEQRQQLVGMLRALDRLGVVATDVINRSKTDLVADLRALRPVLDNLVTAGDDLPKSLELLLNYPFPDQALAAVRGDYFNLSASVYLDLRGVLDTLANTPAASGAGPGGGTALPPLPGLPGLPALPGGAP